jgi:hypothetical protein
MNTDRIPAVPCPTGKWLLDAEKPYVHYTARRLLGADLGEENDRNELLSDPFVLDIAARCRGWQEYVVKRHDKADQPLHWLSLLAYLGFKATDPPMQPVVEEILSFTDEKCIPQILLEIPRVFGGNDTPVRSWVLCNFPTVLYALLESGVRNDITDAALESLIELGSDEGYHCISSMPKFRGPGPKKDICPYATLVTAKALSVLPETRSVPSARNAVEAVLHHWENREKQKLFLFGVGTDYKKLKFPFVWYNLLHVLEVVSRFEWAAADPRFGEMLELLMEKSDEKLRFTPESMYMFYRGQDFANKKQPSRMLTLAALRILIRAGKVPV